MGFKIEDGKGTGVHVGVDSENRMLTLATTQAEDKHSNKEGRVWSIYFTVTPTAANDYFFYFKNTGTEDIAISDIRVSSTVATQLNYHAVTGTPTYTGAEVDITPVNRNLGSAKVPTGIIKHDVNITGLTDAGTFFFEQIPTANTRYKLSTSSNIIIPQNSAVAFERVAATGVITCLVSIYILE